LFFFFIQVVRYFILLPTDFTRINTSKKKNIKNNAFKALLAIYKEFYKLLQF